MIQLGLDDQYKRLNEVRGKEHLSNTQVRFLGFEQNLGLLTDYLTHSLTHSSVHIMRERTYSVQLLQSFREQVTWPTLLDHV